MTTQDTQMSTTPNTEYVSVGSSYWVTTWNWLDGDCDTFPWHFATEAEAEACGDDWVAEQSAEDQEVAGYWVTRVDPPTYPVWKFGARWICDGPEGRFHAKTKAEAIRMLRETG